MTSKSLPIKWKEVSAEEAKRVKIGWPISSTNDLIRYENGLVMPREFTKIADRLYNFPLRDDDIWIVTYPKTGTTWTQEIVWMMVHDVDEKSGSSIPQHVRTPFLDVASLMSPNFLKERNMMPTDPVLCKAMEDPIEYAKTLTGRRVLKTHLPLEFLPPDLLERCKVIYVARNAKDTAVSYYKHNMHVPAHGFVGTFEDFIQFFEEGLVVYGSYWDHVLGGWKVRDHQNVQFLWFEDMKKDTKAIIEKLCVFLNNPLTSAKIEALEHYVSFDVMKNNKMANPMAGIPNPPEGKFMRKGTVGDWKNFFTPERNERWNKSIREKTQGTGLDKLDIFN